MPRYLSAPDYETVQAAVARLIPADDGPGAVEAGVVEYIDGLLGAFLVDPPRIWAVHPRGDEFHPLSALEERAWRHRVGELQDRYRDGLAALGAEFVSLDGDAQDERLRANAEFTALLYDHTCEGMYAAPAYGGNRDLAGWDAIDFRGDVQPIGYTDDEVALP
jgi:gluconate 2-dehydrogenase gamma chain